jgi:hypothetical protein
MGGWEWRLRGLVRRAGAALGEDGDVESIDDFGFWTLPLGQLSAICDCRDPWEQLLFCILERCV